MELNNFYIDNIIKTAMLEDISYLDAATDALFGGGQLMIAQFISKASGILCGTDIALRVFTLFDDTVKIKKNKNDSDTVQSGEIIAEIEGKAATLLKCERTSLNILQHLSGISTATAQYVEKVSGTNAVICETRKTLPGLRPLQKYAVLCGGGKNHRYNLSDGAMIKDNHIDAAGSIEKAVKLTRSKLGHMIKIEVETRSLSEVEQAVTAKAEVIMLDNMNVSDMTLAVALINGRALVEASGGINLDNIRAVAETGVDIISIGALTHSVTALDISMKVISE